VIVELPADVVSCVVEWARMVQKFKQANGAQDKWFDESSTSLDVMVTGKLGEVVIGRALGCVPSFAVSLGGDGGCDLDAWGLRWQVKTSSLTELIFNDENDFTADVAVLVTHLARKDQVAADPRFKILGGISRSKFMRHHGVKDFGYGNRLTVNANNLTDLDFIKQTRGIK